MACVAASSSSSSSFDVSSLLIENHHTFQTPLRFEECTSCRASVTPNEFARHLFECIVRTPEDDDLAKTQEFACADCGNSSSKRGIVFGRSCGHSICSECFFRALTPDVGPARGLLGKLSCPCCSRPIDLEDLVEIIGRPAAVALLSSTLHEVNELRKIEFWDCPMCPSTNTIDRQKTKSKRLNFASALAVLQQECTHCQQQVCLACLKASPSKERVHSSPKEACIQSRLFVAMQALFHLARMIGVSADEYKKLAGSSYSASSSVLVEAPVLQTHRAWASGIGYGGSGGGSSSGIWDPAAKAAEEQKRDKHVARVLGMISRAAVSPIAASTCFLICSSSLLPPLIRSYLKNDSLEDIFARRVVYRPLFDLLRRLLPSPVIRAHFSQSPSPSVGSIVEMLYPLQEKVRRVMKSSQTNVEGAATEAGVATEAGAAIGATVGDGTEDTEGFSTLFHETLMKIDLPSYREKPEISPLSAKAASSSSSSSSEMSFVSGQQYVDALRKHQFAEVANLKKGHFFSGIISAVSPFSRTKLRRLARELDSAISDSFVTAEKTSIFVRVDSSRLDTYKVCITGPRSAPYAFGCFVFDIHLPETFPQSPPKVNLMTTANNTVHFNPNLYSSGYVCLTLLGTWHGTPEEGWQPNFSSLAQVLISIQSFILGADEPWYNEPGYQHSVNSSSSQTANRRYLADTLRVAINDQLENPPPEFADAITQHFIHCQHEVLEYYQAMSKTFAIDLSEQLRRFKTLLAAATSSSASASSSTAATSSGSS